MVTSTAKQAFFNNKRTLSKCKTNGLIKGLLIHTKQISSYFFWTTRLKIIWPKKGRSIRQKSCLAEYSQLRWYITECVPTKALYNKDSIVFELALDWWNACPWSTLYLKQEVLSRAYLKRRQHIANGNGVQKRLLGCHLERNRRCCPSQPAISAHAAAQGVRLPFELIVQVRWEWKSLKQFGIGCKDARSVLSNEPSVALHHQPRTGAGL